MSLYEGMFVMDNRQANRDWDGSLEKLKSLLTKHGAEILHCGKWGERKLAYEIAGRRRGTYILTFFNATGKAVNEIYRECELSDMILRSLILRAEAIPPADQLRGPDELPERPRFGDSAGPARDAAEPPPAPKADAAPAEEEK